MCNRPSSVRQATGQLRACLEIIEYFS